MDKKEASIIKVLFQEIFSWKVHPREVKKRKGVSNSRGCGHLNTRILLLKKYNLEVVIKEVISPLWLLSKQFHTNWVDDMLLHLIYYKQIRMA